MEPLLLLFPLPRLIPLFLRLLLLLSKALQFDIIQWLNVQNCTNILAGEPYFIFNPPSQKPIHLAIEWSYRDGEGLIRQKNGKHIVV